MQRCNEKNVYLIEMYEDSFFPKECVDKVKEQLILLELEIGNGKQEIQKLCDQTIENINDLQDFFEEHESELESVAAESIGNAINRILERFEINLDIEAAMRMREW